MKILGIAGAKRSGKDSSARYIVGNILKQMDVIDKFYISEDGKLMVNYAMKLEDGSLKEGMGEFDLDRIDDGFIYYLEEKVWPHVKIYHFADLLKFILMSLYGVDHKNLYGDTDDRNAESNIAWKDIIKVLPKSVKPSKTPEGNLTYRQFMQHLADILRAVDDDCFIKATLQRVLLEQCPFAIVADVRTINEVKAIQEAGGKVIYHTRRPEPDSHRTENDFEGQNLEELFDFVLDNSNCTITEKNVKIQEKLNEWNWL